MLSLLIGFLIIGFFTMTTILSLNPFETGNPLVTKATIGQTVIAPWQYDGTDNSGNLLFFNGYETSRIPASAKRFSADGQFVNIASHTADTITYEPALDAQLFNPVSIVLGVLVITSMLALPFALGTFSRKLWTQTLKRQGRPNRTLQKRRR